MSKIKMDDVEKLIIEVADSIILPRFRNMKAHEIHFKGDDSPYTIADTEAEAAFSERLRDLLPGSKVVGEEDFEENRSVIKYFSGEDPVWTVDPVDGTKCFIAGEPFYGIIISLNQNNETIAGWLYDPTSKEFVTAEKGSGAFYKGKKLSVLPPASLSEMKGVIGYRIICNWRDFKEECAATLSCPEILPMHSSCHDFARLVAPEGHFSGQLPPIHFHMWKETCTPWDSAAGILIHGESGGYTRHWDKEQFKPNHHGKGTLSAPSEESWDEIAAWVRSFCKV